MKIVLFGGNGNLGKELQKIDSTIVAPSSKLVDISDLNAVRGFLQKTNKVDIVINAAAETDNRKVEKMPVGAIQTNVIGAANVAIVCQELGIRLVYISTDYIYKGDRGNYKETDEILPFNLYSWTKLGGECSAFGVKNHLVIRTSFGKNSFDYPEAFIDKWTSKDYVDRIAPLIYDAALSPLLGTVNLGTERKTLFDHANERNDKVKGVKIEDTPFATPYDTSLNTQKWINYTTSKSIAKPHKNCRACGSSNLTKYLDLGIMPLANNLEFNSSRAKEADRFPLQVLFCEECSLSQLSVVIDPEKMFSYYTYRSSVNTGYVHHCRKMAKELSSKYNLNENSFMVDIAGNDGTLLKQFKEEIGLKVLNIDPATNLTAIAESLGIDSLANFWSSEIAEKVKSEIGKADLITATNVFAHVDDVTDFIKAASILLKENGVLAIEFPYIVDFIEGYEFDTVYFEHLSYFSVRPLIKLADKLNMRVIAVEKQNIHGGSVRVSVTHKHNSLIVENSVLEFEELEKSLGYSSIQKYNQWSNTINDIVQEFALKLLELKKEGKKIAAFAASAKGNTLLNTIGANTDLIRFIADETPEKIGKYSPGTGIPIVNKQSIMKDQPDYIVILSWNFKDEIIEKLDKIYKGKYIIPIPKFNII
jgi:dTDP-4-dehydrorhamnose reductase/ubiquinone/menaquinone biosynthesis C-methylase UbiE